MKFTYQKVIGIKFGVSLNKFWCSSLMDKKNVIKRENRNRSDKLDFSIEIVINTLMS